MADIINFPGEQLEYIDETEFCISCKQKILDRYYELPVRIGSTVTVKGICGPCHVNFLNGNM